MIVFSNERYLPELKTMWNLCFPDTDEFVALYFSKIYKADETLIYLENGIPIASLQMIPHQIKLGNQMHQAVYISGAMTHPYYQRRGFMEALIQQVFEEMKKKNIPLVFLIPQDNPLFDFYGRLGFVGACYRSLQEVKVTRDMLPGMKSFPLANQMMDISFLYRSFLMQKENVVLKTERQVKLMIDDLMMDGGQIFINPDGIAFAYYDSTDKKIVIKELFHRNERTKHSLITSITDYYRTQDVMLYQYLVGKDSEPYGVIKSLDESITLPSDIYMSMMLD